MINRTKENGHRLHEKEPNWTKLIFTVGKRRKTETSKTSTYSASKLCPDIFFLLNLTSYSATLRVISSGGGLGLNGFEEVCGPEGV